MSILDQRAESVADRLWLVTNEDGSQEITDEAGKGNRPGVAPAWRRTYRDVLSHFVRSFESSEAGWLRIYAAIGKGVHPIDGLPGIVFVAGGVAYKAYTGTHHTGRFLGFGGARYRITLESGEVQSNNVWYIGRVPPHLREILKDNATMERA